MRRGTFTDGHRDHCKGWNPVLKAPAEIVTTDEAGQFHRERKPYCAVIENEHGLAVVEMCFFQAYCHVLFFDVQKRVANRYSFVETTGRLFLEEPAVHYYSDDGDRPSRGRSSGSRRTGVFRTTPAEPEDRLLRRKDARM